MPKMDGLTALKLLKSHPDYAHIPVIAITASGADRKKRQQYFDDGFSDYINKPYVLLELLKTLAELLNIELKYSDSTLTPDKNPEIIAPPQQILKQLDDLVQAGDISTLTAQAQEIARLKSGSYQAFAQQLATLAEDFKLNEIKK